MSRWIITSLAIMLVTSNGWWLYHAVDNGATQLYQDQELYEANHRVSALSLLSSCLLAGEPKARAINLLQSIFPDEEPYEKNGAINTTWLSVDLAEDGTISGVELDTVASQWPQFVGPNNSFEADGCAAAQLKR